jgi:hypothetical protein
MEVWLQPSGALANSERRRTPYLGDDVADTVSWEYTARFSAAASLARIRAGELMRVVHASSRSTAPQPLSQSPIALFSTTGPNLRAWAARAKKGTPSSALGGCLLGVLGGRGN